MLELHTRPPTWNSELKIFTDHYGGRVRIPCRQNFMVYHNEEGEYFLQEPPRHVHGPRGGATSGVAGGLEEERFGRMCIRHGKVSRLYLHILWCSFITWRFGK